MQIEPVPTSLAMLAQGDGGIVRAARPPEGADAALRAARRCCLARCWSMPAGCGRCWSTCCGNAVKFTTDGTVTLALGQDGPLADGRVMLTFAVRDTGIGIAADRLDAIFQPFTQADTSMTRRFGGTGLGLTISSRLVALLGGSLDVHSTERVGSEFMVRLPAALASTADLGPAVGRRRRGCCRPT